MNAIIDEVLQRATTPTVSTVRQFASRHQIWTEPALRNLIWKSEPRMSASGEIPGNGLIESGALLRIGRKVLIHEPKFFRWLEEQGQAAR